MRSALASIALLLAFTATSHAAERFRIDPDHTFVHFAVVHTGVSSVRGRIGVLKGGTASLDLEKQTAEMTVDIDLRTIDTGVKRLDAVLNGEMFFDVVRHKTARFTGRASKFTDGVPAEFEGELSLHGVTRPVRLTAERFACKDVKIVVLERYVCGGDLRATVLRSEFGLEKYVSMVSDEVVLTISVEAIREDR